MNRGRKFFDLLNSRGSLMCFPQKLAVFRYSIVYCSRLFHGISTSVPEFDNNAQLKSYNNLYDHSLASSDSFWATLARSRLRWFQDFTKTSECDMNNGNIKWFLNGKINVSGNYL